MIYEALEYIRINLQNFLLDQGINPAGDGNPVVLGNIASAEDNNFDGSDKLVISLVNIEEESAKKNARAYRKRGSEIEYKNAPVILNLYVLFSANQDGYDIALQVLSQVVAFFQGKKSFTFSEAPLPPDVIDLPEDERDDLKLHFDLYTLTFEQINHLWGSLGGKQRPFAMYKLRVVPIELDRILQTSGVIERVNQNTAN